MRGLVSTLPLILVIAGCHHEQAVVKSPAPSPMPATQPAPPVAKTPPAPSTRTCSGDTDCGDKQLCIRGACVDITPELAECSMLRVHFDFNVAQIHSGDLPSLARIARCLRADHELYVRIEGNADERGTEEYNLALADKRATAVATYLSSLGVTKAQLSTVSYGKDKPLCVEHDEECWAKNRRAAVKTKAGKKQ
jgi:peptidoglycan-associated lipoprotein